MGRTKRTKPRLAVAYSRVSTDEQDIGPEVQEAAIRSWCAAHDVELLEPLHVDHGVSGGLDPTARPGLRAAMEAAKEHGAGLLVVHERSRLARDVAAVGWVTYELRRHGCELASTDAPLPGEANDAARIVRGVKDIFAEQEREEIRARTRRALAVKRSKHERISHRPPLGFRFRDGAVVEDPREQRAVAEILRLHGEGMPVSRICRELGRLGHRPRGKAWWPQGVRSVIERETA